jgi:hypothetical protein
MNLSFDAKNYDRRIKNLFSVLVFASLFFISSTSFAQLEPLEINTSIQSGIIQAIDADHPIGKIQLIIVDLDADKAKIVKDEFTKYSGDIIGFGQAVIDNKIILTFKNPIYPNFLLAILDRVNIKGYYHNESGLEISFIKDGVSAFIR